MNTQQPNVSDDRVARGAEDLTTKDTKNTKNCESIADGFTLGQHPCFHSSILPFFRSSILPFFRPRPPIALFTFCTLFLLASTARGTEYFVATNGLDSRDGTNGWSDALLTIGTAVAKATNPGDIVTVSNGTYNIAAQIAITNAITVQSFGGDVYGGLGNASNTVVQRSTSAGMTRVFMVSNTNAVVQGLTIRNGAGHGSFGWSGLGVRMTDGLVRDCIIKENGTDGTIDMSHLQGSGVYMTGGTVSNCIIQANLSVRGGSTEGAGIYSTGGRILSCQILDNRQISQSGGGVYASSASVLIRNCLIARNTAGGSGGGGVYGGTVESCTIVSNIAASGTSSGGGVYGSTVMNSIVLKNRTGSGVLSVADYAGSAFSYSCATPKPSGIGNVDYAAFVNVGAGDYRLMACPAVDAGTNLAWMAGTLDLAGNPRTNGVNNRVDMGAYELVPGALQCGLAADVTSVTVPSNVVFTAYLAGTNQNATSYTWDFGDGNTTNGATLAVVPHLYSAAGLYTVKLTVFNDASESASASNVGYITAWGTNAFVWAGSPAPGAPYHTWTNAAHAIGDAVAAVPAGTTVIVTNGTYNIGVQIFVDKAMAMRSFGNGVYGGLANASNTVIDAGGGAIRAMLISSTLASVDGFTIQRGEQPSKGGMDLQGAGVWLYGGVLQNCIVQDNNRQSPSRNYNFTQGGGIYLSGGGTVSNCVIRRNVGFGPSAWGGGVYMNSGLLTHCQVYSNVNYSGAAGAGVYMTGGTTRNCLMYGNSSDSGGGVYVGGGALESCTIVTNSAASGGNGGGVYLAAGTVNNSIVYFNTVGGVHSNLNTTAGLGYCCSINPGSTTNGNIVEAPIFAGATNGDYRLSPGSPGIDQGTNQAWMSGSPDLGGSNARKLFGGVAGTKTAPIVDMGAYEYLFPIPKGMIFWVR